jgi:futalosine hydrolase
VKRLNPHVESMEGAAFFYACMIEKIPCAQIRAVSNFIEKRNRDNWNIALAIKNLNETAIEIINNL